ncbi:MAG: ribose 5-phosphate isomerase B [Zavarzinella sp.]
MKIVVGSDHRGFAIKAKTIDLLRKLGLEVVDQGAFNGEDPADYPDYAIPVAEAVARGDADRGILICGTGFGMCIAANKVAGVRAVTCRDQIEAELSRRHNDANILCFSADFLGNDDAERMVKIWIETEFEGGRHDRRLLKIRDYEANH